MKKQRLVKENECFVCKTELKKDNFYIFHTTQEVRYLCPVCFEQSKDAINATKSKEQNVE